MKKELAWARKLAFWGPAERLKLLNDKSIKTSDLAAVADRMIKAKKRGKGSLMRRMRQAEQGEEDIMSRGAKKPKSRKAHSELCELRPSRAVAIRSRFL